jgi:hypothetical protein
LDRAVRITSWLTATVKQQSACLPSRTFKYVEEVSSERLMCSTLDAKKVERIS